MLLLLVAWLHLINVLFVLFVFWLLFDNIVFVYCVTCSFHVLISSNGNLVASCESAISPRHIFATIVARELFLQSWTSIAPARSDGKKEFSRTCT